MNTNSTDIDSSGKGTVSGVDADAPVVNQHKISDNNAITAMVPEVKSGCKSGANHSDSLVPLSEHWPSPSIEIPSVEGLDDDEYLSRQVYESRFWEVEEGSGQIYDVQGRLKASLEFWSDTLKVTQPVLDWISEGYKLPLLSVPPPRYQPNQKSTLTEYEFVSAAIQELLSNRCVHKVSESPSPLSVVTNAEGKKRLVVNLRYLNQYLLKQKFKYKDMRVALLMFQSGDFMCSFDLKSGYHHIDIHSEH